MPANFMSVGIGVLNDPAKSALPSDAAARLVNQALSGPVSRGDPVRLAILLATADWCDPRHSISAPICDSLEKQLRQEVRLIGASMARLFCSVGGFSNIEHGLILILLCSSELYATVGQLPNPHGLAPRELRPQLEKLSKEIASRNRIGGSSNRFLLGFFPGFFLDKRGHRSFRDNELHDGVLAVFDHRLPIFGGSSADDLVPSRGYQFIGRECIESGLVLAHIETDIAVGMAVEHGFHAIRSRRVRVDVLANEAEDSSYDVSMFDGQSGASFVRELAKTTDFPLGRPLFGLPCGDDYHIIQALDTPRDDAAPVRLNRRVRKEDSLYILNASAEDMSNATSGAIREAVRRAGAPAKEMALLFGVSCTARYRHYEQLGLGWETAFRGVAQQYPGVPLVGGLCAGEFAVDSRNRRRSNNLSIAIGCFANGPIPEAHSRDLQRRLVVAAGELAVCTSPKDVAEKALRIAMANGATGGQICHVDYKLGRILGLSEPYGYAARLPEYPHDWPKVLKLTDRPIPGAADTVYALPAHLSTSAVAVSPTGPPPTDFRATPRPELNDILPLAAVTRHAIFILDSRKSSYCDQRAVEAGKIVTQLVIPLVGTGNRVIATFQLSFPDLRQLDREEFGVWVSFAQKIAGNLERAWEQWERDLSRDLSEIADGVLHEPVGTEPWAEESRKRFLRAIAELTGVQSLHIRTFVPGSTPGHERFRMLTASGPVAVAHAAVRPFIFDREGSCHMSALRTGPLYTNTRQATAASFAGISEIASGGSEEQQQFIEWTETICSSAVLPLTRPDDPKTLGALVLNDPQPWFFNERMRRSVEMAARLTGLILRTRRAEYYRELGNRLQRTDREWMPNPPQSAQESSQTWLRTRLREACEIVGADWGAIFCWHPTPEKVILHTAYNWFKPDQEGRAGYALGEGWVGSVAASGNEIEIQRPDLPGARPSLCKYHQDILPPNESQEASKMPRIALRLTSGPSLVGIAVLGFYPRNIPRLDELDEADHGYLCEIGRLLTLRLAWTRHQEDQSAAERVRDAIQKVPTMLGSGGAEPDGTAIMSVLRTACYAERASFYRLVGKKLQHAWTSWPNESPFQSCAAEPFEPQGSCLDVLQGRPCIIKSRDDPALQAWPDNKDVRTLFAAPAFSQSNDVMGVLTLANRAISPDHPFEMFDLRESRTVEGVARMVGSYLGFRESILAQKDAISQIEAVSEEATQSVVAALLEQDIRHPVHSIRRNVEYLVRLNVDEDERRRTHDAIIADCDLVIKIIQSAVSRRAPLPHSWRVSDIVTETRLVVGCQVPHGVELKINSAIDKVVKGRLWDVVSSLVHLIRNALEAIEDKGTIWISTQESHDGQWADISVENTGHNYTQAEVDDFLRLGFTTKKGGHGGYGLAIAQEHIRAARGRLILTPRSDGGVKAIVSLPVSEEKAAEV
jgi:signal transduction histidine kinase